VRDRPCGLLVSVQLDVLLARHRQYIGLRPGLQPHPQPAIIAVHAFTCDPRSEGRARPTIEEG
jgi:hypothetical protein